MASNFKSPPALNENSVYEQWKKEIAVWQAFTDLNAGKQGPVIFLTLSGKAREAVLELDVSKLTDKDGVKNVFVSKLDTLYLEDKNHSAYAAYENFERSPEMNMKDFINKFECLYKKIRVFNMELPDGVLPYRVLKSANLSTEN